MSTVISPVAIAFKMVNQEILEELELVELSSVLTFSVSSAIDKRVRVRVTKRIVMTLKAGCAFRVYYHLRG